MDDLPTRHFVEHLQRGVRVTDTDKEHEQDVAGAKVGRDIELGWGSEAEAAHEAKRVEERVEGAGGRAGVEGREGEEKAEGREHPEHAEERPERAVGEGCEAGHLEQGDDRGGSRAVAPASVWERRERAMAKTGSESGNGGATWKSAWLRARTASSGMAARRSRQQMEDDGECR
jgi:hypothetical protein|uniref:Uncharacterized protein n=1 Tax=Zea mays TaxID=4577 RepID=A0A804PE35_MAIZE